MSYKILISFLCGFDPEVGKRFWMFVTEEVEIVEKRMMKTVTDLVCKCMKEHGFVQKDQTSIQIYFCISDIVIDEYTSNEDIMLLCHVMEEYHCNVKSLYLKSQSHLQTICLSIEGLLLPVEGARITSLTLDDVTMTHHGYEQLSESLTSSSCLEYLGLIDVRCTEHSDGCCIPNLDLQKHDKLKQLRLRSLSIEGLLIPVEGARITSLELWNVTMTHHDCEQMSESFSSCSHLEDMSLRGVRCREHRHSCCIPVLDLPKHDKLKTLYLQYIFIEGLLLPVEGAGITSLKMVSVTMTHHGCEQLSESLSSCSHLEDLSLTLVRCREHSDRKLSDSCCIPVRDLQKHDKMKTLYLKYISIEGLLIPVEGARITWLKLDNVTMAHHGWEQLSESMTSSSRLEYLYLYKVRCREHSDSCCIRVLDLQKHDKMETTELRHLSIEGLLLPVEGARITSLRLDNVTMAHHGWEQLSESLASSSRLAKLYLVDVRCREYSDSYCIPFLDLQKHDKMETLDLRSLSIAGLLIPVEGSRITSLHLVNVTMPHHSCEQLSESLTFCTCLEYLYLTRVKCSEHSDSCCIPVLDLQKHDKMKILVLQDISIEGRLLHIEGARITSLTLKNVTMPHQRCVKLSRSFSSSSPLEHLDLTRVRCSEHSDSSCISVIDLQNNDKLKTLYLRFLSIEGLLIPVEGVRITSLHLVNVTMPHHSCVKLSRSFSSSSPLEHLDLTRVRCSEHSDSSCISVIDLQNNDKLKTLYLRFLSIEGLLIPAEGARITSLYLGDITMPHQSCEQLSAAFSSRPELENWRPFKSWMLPNKVQCREHSDNSCQTVKDITNFIKYH